MHWRSFAYTLTPLSLSWTPSPQIWAMKFGLSRKEHVQSSQQRSSNEKAQLMFEDRTGHLSLAIQTHGLNKGQM
jgi:hypothetical protein